MYFTGMKLLKINIYSYLLKTLQMLVLSSWGKRILFVYYVEHTLDQSDCSVDWIKSTDVSVDLQKILSALIRNA